MSELSKERLENYVSGRWYPDADYVKAMARELLALRERAEPVYQVQAMDWHDVEKYLYDEALDRGIRCRVLYTAPPATVVPKIDRKAICNKAHWLCARSPGATFYNAAEFALDEVMELLAPPAPVVPEPVSQPYKLPEWTNEQCLEFLAVAFRHAEIKGDFDLDDLRLGVKMANAMTSSKEG